MKRLLTVAVGMPANHHPPDDEPPRDNAREQAGTVGTAQNITPDFVTLRALAQGAKPWRVKTTKSNGSIVEFARYATIAEARIIVAALVKVGCPATIEQASS